MNKILIIEDDQIVANIYRNKFSIEGYQVEVANDADKGLELLESFHPDALVLDLMLPRTTGVDLMKVIRARPGCEKLPVIVFSNTYLTNMVQEAWKAGATKCLSKANCTPKQVIDVLKTVLNNGNLTPPGEASHPEAAALKPVTRVQQSAPTATHSSPFVPNDAEFQAELLKNFVQGLPAALTGLRGQLQNLIKADNEQVQLKSIQDLYRRIHALTGNAAVVGLSEIAHFADALEALLKELMEKPKNMNPSSFRTVANGVDFLGILFERRNQPSTEDLSPANIMVIDDEAISRRAVTYALEKARLKAVSMDDPTAAFKMLSEQPFDLIFLDIDMPGMNGYELCAKLRKLPQHAKTPVVFVTSLTGFESRASSMISGGNDFIGKPFLFMEIAVKALVYLFKNRLESNARN